MERYTIPASLVGAALVVAGGLSLLLDPEARWLPAVNAGLGAFLIAVAGVLNRDLFRQYSRWLNAFWGGIMVLAILAMVNFLSHRYDKRLDVTEGKLHSLADLTVKTLEGLDREVTALAFMEGGKNDALHSLLEEYGTHGGGRFRFEFIDPDRDPERTREYGVRAYNTLVLAAGSAGRQSVTELAEKEITNALLKVLRDRQEFVYLTVGHGEHGPGSGEQDLGHLKDRLRDIDYVVRDSLFLARERRVPEDCRVLAIAGPRSPFLQTEVDAVADYLARGGSVLLLVDPLGDTALEGLLGRWGVETGDDFVIDTSGMGSLFGLDFTIPVATTYGEHAVTRKHRGGVMTFYELARSVTVDTAAAVAAGRRSAVLVHTSRQSWAEADLSALREGGGQRTVRLDDTDRPGPVPLAVAVQDSAGGGGRLVVFGDSDFATNRYFDLQGNGDLVLNALSWLAEDESLISIRPREAGFSPIALNQRQSEWVFWLTVILYPAVVAVTGVLVVSRKGRWSLRDLAAAGLGILLSLGVVGLLNFVGDRYHWRLDLTQDKLFTLSPKTVDVLRDAEAQARYVSVKTFMAETEGERFRQILQEYRYASPHFQSAVVDPQKEALQVRQYGIRERGTSLVEVTGEGRQATERFTEQSEEALTNAIRRALAANERTIGFTGGHGEGQLTQVDGEGYSILNGRLKEMNLQIRDGLDPGSPGSFDQVQVLAVLGPKRPLAADAVSGVAAFLRGGGDVLLLEDPGVDCGLEPLLAEEYAVDVGQDFVVDLSGIGQLLGADVSVPVVLRYGDHPITQKMGRSTMSYFPLARSVSAAGRSPRGEAVELAYTDRNAWGETDLGPIRGEGGGSVAYDAERDRPGPLALAVALTADADSSEGADKSRLVVFGDSDFARNQHFGQQANGELLVSAVRWLAEGEDVLDIAAKEPRFSPVNLYGSAGTLVLWVSVFVLPFAVALSGFVIMLRRGYEAYSSGFVSWLVYSFVALGLYYFGLGVIGESEASPAKAEGYLALALLSGGLAYGLFHRAPWAWPVALAAAVANAGLGFVAVPEETLQLVFAGLNVANACILVWIRRDFQPAAAGEAPPPGRAVTA